MLKTSDFDPKQGICFTPRQDWYVAMMSDVQNCAEISLYLQCHKYEVACGAQVMTVTVVCMLSSDIHMKTCEWNKSAMRLPLPQLHHKWSQNYGIDGSKQGETFDVLGFFLRSKLIPLFRNPKRLLSPNLHFFVSQLDPVSGPSPGRIGLKNFIFISFHYLWAVRSAIHGISMFMPHMNNRSQQHWINVSSKYWTQKSVCIEVIITRGITIALTWIILPLATCLYMVSTRSQTFMKLSEIKQKRKHYLHVMYRCESMDQGPLSHSPLRLFLIVWFTILAIEDS